MKPMFTLLFLILVFASIQGCKSGDASSKSELQEPVVQEMNIVTSDKPATEQEPANE